MRPLFDGVELELDGAAVNASPDPDDPTRVSLRVPTEWLVEFNREGATISVPLAVWDYLRDLVYFEPWHHWATADEVGPAAAQSLRDRDAAVRDARGRIKKL